MKTKYLKHIILFLTIMIFLNPSVVQAQESETEVMVSEDFQYIKSSRTDAVTIVGYIGKEEKIVIPAYIDGKKVGEADFSGEYQKINSMTKEIEISHGIAAIDGFYKFNKLEKVTLPESVAVIEEEAFANCRYLKKIYIPDSVMMIGKSAFASCDRLQEVRLPIGLESIEEGTFAFCKKLKKIDIPDSVTEIGEAAFYYCISLKEAVIPDSVTEIGEYAFAECIKLSKVKLSKNIRTIRRATFLICNFKTIQIPKKVTRIEKSAFGGVPLTKIEIPSKVKYIGSYAFSGCEKLKNITFKGKNPPQIKNRVFLDIHKKAVFDVPNKSINKYKKILQNKKVYNGKKLNIK